MLIADEIRLLVRRLAIPGWLPEAQFHALHDRRDVVLRALGRAGMDPSTLTFPGPVPASVAEAARALADDIEAAAR